MSIKGIRRQAWLVYGWQVKRCDPFVTHEPYLSALETGL